ncbi:MAG TPA: 6-carboxytetrahydropterin synthase QueD [Candidatus Desulfofervidus auxilii]|uniref:6-carboxy-5,6,7,8-tetrahydropterin synthase n=1 Tax=Desulfofervidus auxilii TaxID=1621989 RepID=A0A7C0Y6T8_DESA2|nr:6-carboxytetrahydropterin synthase QueD [Candidatus Desulfofervidus auxilii]
MYALKVISQFAAAHRLRHYQGKCEALHGHNWQVEIEVRSKTLNTAGMVMDFQDLKALLKECLAKLDHAYLNEIPPFDKENPTSERIACYIFKQLKKALPPQVSIGKVTVWESDTACAEYWEEDASTSKD